MLLLTITISKTYGQGSADPGGVGSSNNGSPGGGYGSSTFDNPTGSVPFDGGLSIILIAAGAGVGAKRKERRMQNA